MLKNILSSHTLFSGFLLFYFLTVIFTALYIVHLKKEKPRHNVYLKEGYPFDCLITVEPSVNNEWK